MRVTTTVTGAEEVRRMLRRIGQQSQAVALAQTAEELEDLIGRDVARHNKTGALFRSLFKRRIPGGVEIAHDLQVAPQATWVHWGTRPHAILPKRKKALRWATRAGSFVFAGKVNHPGNKADPWMVRAAAIAPQVFRRHVEAHIARLQQER